MQKSFETVSIVVPNWNGYALLSKYLRSVCDGAPDAEIIVVDDGSTDESVSFLKKEYPDVKLVELPKHQGFASAVNAGVNAAIGSIVVLLNTDVSPAKGFLSPLLKHFSDPSVFAVGCLEKSKEGGKTVFRGRGEAGWKRGFFVHWKGSATRTDTAWVSGGSGAFRKSTWMILGGMDTLFDPYYWEDIDLSYRARKAGYRLLFEPKSIVRHFHEEGKIRSTFEKTTVSRIAYRNQFIFIWKNISDPLYLLEHIVWTPIRLLQAGLRGDGAMIAGYAQAVFLLPGIFSHRWTNQSSWKISDRELLGGGRG